MLARRKKLCIVVTVLLLLEPTRLTHKNDVLVERITFYSTQTRHLGFLVLGVFKCVPVHVHI